MSRSLFLRLILLFAGLPAFAQDAVYVSTGAFGEPLFSDQRQSTTNTTTLTLNPPPFSASSAAETEAITQSYLQLIDALTAARIARAEQAATVRPKPQIASPVPLPAPRRSYDVYPYPRPVAVPRIEAPVSESTRAPFAPIFEPKPPAFRN